MRLDPASGALLNERIQEFPRIDLVHPAAGCGFVLSAEAGRDTSQSRFRSIRRKAVPRRPSTSGFAHA